MIQYKHYQENLYAEDGAPRGRSKGKKWLFFKAVMAVGRERKLIVLKKFTKKLMVSIGAALCLQSTVLAADLSEWAISDYQAANQAGLVSYTVASNNLKDNITREEFCELAVNLYEKLTNEKMAAPEVSPFVDTDSTVVSQAYYYGLVSGTSDTTFSPSKQVTRQEMVKMLVNTLTAGGAEMALSDGKSDSVLNQFNDGSSVSQWAKPAMITALNYSLINGVTADQLKPQGNTTREQAVASVNRSYNQFTKTRAALLEVPQIIIPAEDQIITGQAFNVSWTPIGDAVDYYIIIKDASSTTIYTDDVGAGQTSLAVDGSHLKGGQYYSVTVGAQLSSGSQVFGVPVDFKYGNAKSAASGMPVQKVAMNSSQKKVIDTAEKYIGVKYVYGGTTPNGFDCSGFAQYVMNENGVTLHRTSREQYASDGVSVSKSELQPGDLVFFGTGGSVSHVGIYAGNGQMIHSPSTGKTVCYTSIESNYYKSRYIGGKRVLG